MEGFRFEAEDEDGAVGGTGKEEEETSSAGEVARRVQGWKSLLERVWAKIQKLLISREKTAVCRPLASPVGHGQSQIAVVNVWSMEQHFLVRKCLQVTAANKSFIF